MLEKLVDCYFQACCKLVLDIDYMFFEGAIPAYSEDFQQIFKFANF